METKITKEKIKEILLAAIAERTDMSYYDDDGNLQIDEGNRGWQEAIGYVAEKLGVTL